MLHLVLFGSCAQRGEQMYVTDWDFGIDSFREVLGFFHAAGGVEATNFSGYVKPQLLGVPLTMETILDRDVFGDAFLKKRLHIKNPDHIAALLELRDKVDSKVVLVRN